MGRRGSTARVLARDVGGMPVWALIASLLLAIGAVTAFVAASAAQTGAAPFTPPTDAVTPALPQPMPLVVFLGDAYTQGGGDTWPEIVGEERGWDIANLALRGTGYVRTAGEEECGRPTCGAFEEISAEIVGSPRIIFVAGGRQDLGLETADVAEAASRLFVNLRDRYPAAQLFVVNPWYDDDVPPAQLAELEAAVRSAAAEADAVFLDTGQPLADRPDLLGDDGIHPNAAGYRALAAAVERELAGQLSP